MVSTVKFAEARTFMYESREGRLLSVGLADGKRVNREWNFDRDGRHRERHSRKLLASYEVS